MDVILSFDTEDYVTPEAADAQKWWAEELTKRELRGSFQCVGEVIRGLIARERHDVIEALSAHEIGYHSDYHSAFPTHPVALENRSLSEGIEWVLRREAAGVASLVKTFGRVPVTYCSPGDSWTPATLLAMGLMGIKVAAGYPVFEGWYCGMLTKMYNLCIDRYFKGYRGSDRELFIKDFEALEKTKGEGTAIVIFSHPTRLVTSEFWDRPFFKGADIPIRELPAAPLRSEGDIQENKDRVCYWLDRLATKPGVRFIDHATCYAERCSKGRDLNKLLAECGLSPIQVGELPLRELEPETSGVASAMSRFRYSWQIFPDDFTGEAIIEQGKRLLWTYQRSV